MHERFFDTWLLNINLDAAVSGWRKNPNAESSLKKLEYLLRHAKEETLTVKVKGEILQRHDTESMSIKSKLKDYGVVEGESLVFTMGQSLSARIGQIKKESFLVLESIHGQKFFFSPQDIVSLSVK